MTFDPHGTLVTVLGISGYWNLVWIIPLCALLGLVLAALVPPKRPPNPPYVGFDPGEKVTGTAFYEPGDPPGVYNIRTGSEIHRQIEAYQKELRDADPHPGRLCSPHCWSKLGGHRRTY